MRLSFLNFLLATLLAGTASIAFADAPHIKCGHPTRGIATHFSDVKSGPHTITISQHISAGSVQLENFARSLGVIDDRPFSGRLVLTYPDKNCYFSDNTQKVLATCELSSEHNTVKAIETDGTLRGELELSKFDVRVFDIRRTVATEHGNRTWKSLEINVIARPASEPFENVYLSFAPHSDCVPWNLEP